MSEIAPDVVTVRGPEGIPFSVIDAGPRDGACVLLCVHGVGGTREQWRPQVAYFRDRARVVVPDLRGHGSTPAQDSYAIDQIVGDLVSLIDARAIRTPLVVLGHSYGGIFALHLALTHPELVARVVLIGVAPRFNYGPLFTLAARAPVPDRLLELLRRRFFAYRFHATAGVMRAYLREALLPWHGWDRLEEIRQPVLVLAGKLDAVAPPAAVARMVARMPQGELRIVPRAMHLIHLQQPDATNRLIEAFLGLGRPRADAGESLIARAR
jgi:3-oxoadipate enol-lactonase